MNSDPHDAAVSGRQGGLPGCACCCSAWGTSMSCFTTTPRPPARVLNLALTSREKGRTPCPWPAFPITSWMPTWAKLIAAGLRVAICDQVEDPRQAKGLVKRELTRIVSRGTVTDDALLDPRENNFLAALVPRQTAGLAWVELSTGSLSGRLQFPAAGWPTSWPASRRWSACWPKTPSLPPHVLADGMLVTRRPDWVFAQHAAPRNRWPNISARTRSRGLALPTTTPPAIRAAGAIIEYLAETQKASIGHIDRLLPYRPGTPLEIDEATRRSLEVTRTLRDGSRDGSLLGVLDRTVTAMGSR